MYSNFDHIKVEGDSPLIHSIEAFSNASKVSDNPYLKFINEQIVKFSNEGYFEIFIFDEPFINWDKPYKDWNDSNEFVAFNYLTRHGYQVKVVETPTIKKSLHISWGSSYNKTINLKSAYERCLECVSEARKRITYHDIK